MLERCLQEIQRSILSLLQLTHPEKVSKWKPTVMICSEAKLELDDNQGICASYNISTLQNMTSDSSHVYNKYDHNYTREVNDRGLNWNWSTYLAYITFLRRNYCHYFFFHLLIWNWIQAIDSQAEGERKNCSSKI